MFFDRRWLSKLGACWSVQVAADHPHTGLIQDFPLMFFWLRFYQRWLMEIEIRRKPSKRWVSHLCTIWALITWLQGLCKASSGPPPNDGQEQRRCSSKCRLGTTPQISTRLPTHSLQNVSQSALRSNKRQTSWGDTSLIQHKLCGWSINKKNEDRRKRLRTDCEKEWASRESRRRSMKHWIQ